MKRNILIEKLNEICSCSGKPIMIVPIHLCKNTRFNLYFEKESNYDKSRGITYKDCNAVSILEDILLLNTRAIKYTKGIEYTYDFIGYQECPMWLLKRILLNIPNRPDLKIWYDLNEHL